ncbi:MAG: T9SS type A sorting domain-containing protein [bacterium]
MNTVSQNILKIMIISVIIFLSPVYSQTELFNNLGKISTDATVNTPVAQQFKTTSTLKFIHKVELGIYKGGVAGSFTVSIYSDNGSDEIDAEEVLLFSGDRDDLPDNSDTKFTIEGDNLPCELNGGLVGTKYWIYVESSSNNVFKWSYAEDTPDGNSGDGDGFLTRNLLEVDYSDVQPMLLKITADTQLPVELTSFTSSVTNDNVILNWQTATEVNNYGFEIERKIPLNPPPSKGCRTGLIKGDAASAEGDWKTLGFVEGNGNSNSTKEYSFVDNNITGGNYSYRLKQIDTDGSYSYSNEIIVETGHAPSLPNEFELYQNYPNPFNPTTTIKYTIPADVKAPCVASLRVYDILGNQVATLINEQKEPGYYEVKFEASHFPSGVYFYVLHAGEEFHAVKKMLFLK